MSFENLTNRVIYLETRKHLANLFGVNKIEQLSESETITLSSTTHNYLISRITETIFDGQERGVFLEGSGDQIRPTHLSIGSEFDLENETPTMPVSNIWFFELWRKKFQPALCLFHTHGDFSAQWASNKQILSYSPFPDVKLDAFQTSALFSLFTGNFSGNDIVVFEKNLVYFKSMLLGSSMGFRCLVDYSPKWSYPGSDFATYYKTAWEELLKSEVIRMIEERNSVVDQPVFQQKVDQLLVGFAHQKGLLSFGNNDFHNPKLEKISQN